MHTSFDLNKADKQNKAEKEFDATQMTGVLPPAFKLTAEPVSPPTNPIPPNEGNGTGNKEPTIQKEAREVESPISTPSTAANPAGGMPVTVTPGPGVTEVPIGEAQETSAPTQAPQNGRSTANPTHDEQVEMLFQRMIQRSGPEGWHIVLTRRGSDRGSLEQRRLVEEASRRLSASIQSSAGLSTRKDAQHPPELGWRRIRNQEGHAYMARNHDDNPQAVEHANYCRTATLGMVGVASPTPLQSEIFQLFRLVQSEEGDTSAINAYDGQIVTIGSGFSARSGNALEVLQRLPGPYLDRLYSAGIYIGEGSDFRVFDASSNRVLSGENAWRNIRNRPELLQYLIYLAQSTDSMAGDNGEVRESRNWMLRAQWEQFEAENTPFLSGPGMRLDLNVRILLVKLHHWYPGTFSWWRVVDRIDRSRHRFHFNRAMRWARGRLQQRDFAQLNRMRRFFEITNFAAVEAHINTQYGR